MRTSPLRGPDPVGILFPPPLEHPVQLALEVRHHGTGQECHEDIDITLPH